MVLVIARAVWHRAVVTCTARIRTVGDWDSRLPRQRPNRNWSKIELRGSGR